MKNSTGFGNCRARLALRIAAILVMVVSSVLGCAAQAAEAPDLESGFAHPPQSAYPMTWWHWMNGHVSRQGITLDLEAARRAGIAGVQLFQVGKGYLPTGPAPFGSPQNTELVRFAAREAGRLHLEFGLHNAPGWSSSGGPWVTPALSQQVLTWSETHIQGGRVVNVQLPRPNAILDFYHDSVVLAFPTPAGGPQQIADWRTKGNYPPLREPGSWIPGTVGRGGAPPVPLPAWGTAVIDPATVIDLTAKMDASGTLHWNAPAGDWTVLRFGHTTTASPNAPAPEGGEGLDVDKFNPAAVEFHFQHFFAPFMRDLEPLAAQGALDVTIDSYETGLQNWGDNFPAQFRSLRGYDLLPYLPAMTGRVVGSAELSDRFLWDMRKTHAELMKQNYYARFVELAHAHKMKAFIEPYTPQIFDEMAVGSLPDVPMGEFWQGGTNHHSTKMIASVAHVNGRRVVAAESFTGRSDWTESPYSLKGIGDFMFTQGINRMVFHVDAMQPNPTAAPGMTMGPYGGYFNRMNTWFASASAWTTYLARCQYLLQQGLFVADLLYFAGENSPLRTPVLDATNPKPRIAGYPSLAPVPPRGYDFDNVDLDTLLTRVSIRNGNIVFPDGMSYRVFVLPPTPTITIAAIHRIDELVNGGMTLIVDGPPPTATPGLADYPKSENELRSIAADLWGNLDGVGRTERAVGKGRVIWTRGMNETLHRLGIAPDFEFHAEDADDAPIHAIHRRAGSDDIYFIANRGNRAERLRCTFRVAGKQPELWNPVTGRIDPLPIYTESAGRITLPLRLEPSGSAFVVFRHASAGHLTQIALDSAPALDSQPFPSESSRQPVRVAVPSAAVRASGNNTGSHTGEAQESLPIDPPSAVDDNEGIRVWQNGAYTLRSSNGRARRVVIRDLDQPVELKGPWHVSFPPNLGAPPSIDLPELASLSLSKEPGVRYFSGSATYEKSFEVAPSQLAGGKRLFLDLGRVEVLASVTVNGQELGILWNAPFRIDITGAAYPGVNRLRVAITNLWPNRLIGDEQQPSDATYAPSKEDGCCAITKMPAWYDAGLPRPGPRFTFTTWQHFSKDSPLPDSGLIGPVYLRSDRAISAETK